MRRALHTRPLRAFAIAAAAAAAAFASASAGGCGASYRAADTSTDASSERDGATNDGATSDAGADANACGGADLQNDPKSCGTCGHDCLGGSCSKGRCQGIQLAAVNAPLAHVLVNGSYVYVSTVSTSGTQLAGIWRVPKAGGVPEVYVTLRGAEAMAVLDDKLYFVDSDLRENGVDQHGGLYACPLAGPAPCAPTLIAAAEAPRALSVDKGRVLYTDYAPTGGLTVYTPPAAPVVLVTNTPTSGVGGTTDLFVDGDHAFIATTFFGTRPQKARLYDVLPDGGETLLYTYTSDTANAGRLAVDPDDIFFSAFDFKTTTGGVVRRLPRSGGSVCDLGGAANTRPYGIHADATHVYWANQGFGVEEPYVNGTVVSCERAGCCTTPHVLWTGDEPVAVTGDADALYFTTQPSGGVWKIAKP